MKIHISSRAVGKGVWAPCRTQYSPLLFPTPA